MKRIQIKDQHLDQLNQENNHLRDNLMKKKEKAQSHKAQIGQLFTAKKSLEQDVEKKKGELLSQQQTIAQMQQCISNLTTQCKEMQQMLEPNNQSSDANASENQLEFGRKSQSSLINFLDSKTGKKKLSIKTVRNSLSLAFLKPEKKVSSYDSPKKPSQQTPLQTGGQNKSPPSKTVNELPD